MKRPCAEAVPVVSSLIPDISRRSLDICRRRRRVRCWWQVAFGRPRVRRAEQVRLRARAARLEDRNHIGMVL